MPARESNSMSATSNGSRYRQVLLDAIRALSKDGSFDPADVMRQTIQAIGGPAAESLKRAVLCYFNALLRTGTIGLGDTGSLGLSQSLPGGLNAKWPYGFCHVSPEGKEVLNQAGRDPINPPGYLDYLEQEVSLDDITRGYVEEALNTYRACCYKATAVLIGAAVENLVLMLRDKLL